MKIALNMGQDTDLRGPAAQDRALELDILSVRSGDWSAKQRLVRQFLPLITAAAEKLTDDATKRNSYIEAGKEGVVRAAKKYKKSDGAHMFRIAVVEHMENAMGRVDKGGFFGRLFGRG